MVRSMFPSGIQKVRKDRRSTILIIFQMSVVRIELVFPSSMCVVQNHVASVEEVVVTKDQVVGGVVSGK